ncbi:MAG: hypothetical protein ACTSXZ_02140, partial [Alphaproteobacteria bacterium]
MKALLSLLIFLFLLIPSPSQANSGGGYYEYYNLWDTVKYSRDGSQLWAEAEENYVGDDYEYYESYSQLISLVVDPADNIFVLGYLDNYMDSNLLMYNADGTLLWQASLTAEKATAMAALPGADSPGPVCVAGVNEYSNPNPVTECYRIDGSVLWTATLVSPLITYVWDIALDTSGNAYITGFVEETSRDFATVKYNTDGQEQWVARYDFEDLNDEALAVAVDSQGDAIVTGVSNQDITTIKYDDEGQIVWLANFDGALPSLMAAED